MAIDTRGLGGEGAPSRSPAASLRRVRSWILPLLMLLTAVACNTTGRDGATLARSPSSAVWPGLDRTAMPYEDPFAFDGKSTPSSSERTARTYDVSDLLEKVQDFAGPEIRVSSARATGRRASAPDPRLLDDLRESLVRNADEVWIVVDDGSGEASGTAADDLRSGGMWVGESEFSAIPVPLIHTDVHATITGFLSTVRVQQQYRNDSDTVIEARYLFPLPHDSAVRDFEVQVGDRRIVGVVREKEEAERIYREAQARGQTASLLAQERPNVFVQKLSKLDPGVPIDVTLTYDAPLRFRDGDLEWVFPMVVGPRYRSTFRQDFAAEERCGHDIAITVDVEDAPEWTELESPSHEVVVGELGGGRFRVELEDEAVIPNRDFVLRTWGAGDAVRSSFVARRDENGEGTFQLMLVPPRIDLGQLPALEFVFVIDTSGSMNGMPLELCRRAVTHGLGLLGPEDTFRVLRFSNQASALSKNALPATDRNIARAQEYVEELVTNGGTEMMTGIRAALRPAPDRTRPRVVVFLTDGYIGNEDELFAEVARSIGTTRIFSFGVGSSVNHHALEGLARFGRGVAAYVVEERAAEPTIEAFYARLFDPVIEDLTIDWGELRVSDVAPHALPDLIAGRPLLLSGRCAGALPERITLRGEARGSAIEIDVPIDARSSDSPAIRSLWARAHLAAWADAEVVEPSEGGREQMVRFALAEGLVSSGTSFIAVDEDEVGGAVPAVRVNVPAAKPVGVPDEAGM